VLIGSPVGSSPGLSLRAVAPLTLPEFAASLAAIGGFETRPRVAVAVSGGPDSMALLLLADRWARQQGGAAWGLTVDHGLRPESADEARRVASWLAARAIPHAILCWSGPKPASGLQEAAREARYRLLAGWCRDQGILHLFVAHHREDQIETYLIRRRAGSGIEGLAGMSAVRELPGCRLVRPLLAVPRERLVALLAVEQQPFLRDPSNLNPCFERARLRLAAVDRSVSPGSGERIAEGGQVAGPRSGPSRAWQSTTPATGARDRAGALVAHNAAAIAADLRASAEARIAREWALARLAAGAVALHPAGFATLDPAALAGADREVVLRLLSRLVLCLGGLRYPARTARLARLLAALAQAEPRPRTLGGCRFVPWRGRLLVLRELALAEAPAVLAPGARLCWDRRFAVSLASRADGALTIGYLGQYAGPAPPGGFRPVLPPLIRAVLPALWDAAGIAAVPHLCHVRPGPPVMAELAFRPVQPLIPPSFTVV
jgi:tRNA(Ile)-lysidine synthase